MKPEAAGPIATPSVRNRLKGRIGSLFDDAIEKFSRVLKIAPRRSDAMRFLELCIRERADLADTRSDYDRAMKEADVWKQKQMLSHDDFDHSDVPPCTVAKPLMAPPPPPPPPTAAPVKGPDGIPGKAPGGIPRP
jgi:hypothetical protein